MHRRRRRRIFARRPLGGRGPVAGLTHLQLPPQLPSTASLASAHVFLSLLRPQLCSVPFTVFNALALNPNSALPSSSSRRRKLFESYACSHSRLSCSFVSLWWRWGDSNASYQCRHSARSTAKLVKQFVFGSISCCHMRFPTAVEGGLAAAHCEKSREFPGSNKVYSTSFAPDNSAWLDYLESIIFFNGFRSCAHFWI